MSNQQETDGELFELKKDIDNNQNNDSDLSELEAQLGQHIRVKAPAYLQRSILAKTKKHASFSWQKLLPSAAAIFIIIVASFLFYIYSKYETEMSSAPILEIDNENKIANIFKNEWGTKELQGQKYYALYYSSSLCKPCVDLLSELNNFYVTQRTKNKNFEIIYIELDKHVQPTNNQIELHFKKVIFNDLLDKKFFKQFKDSHGPTLVVLDNKGNIVTKHKKNTHKNTFRTVLNEFSDLLAKS